MLALPSYIDPETWASYVEMRKATPRVPFTEAAQKLGIKKLMSLHDQGYNAQECLEEAIINGWRSFFPPKGQQSHKKPRQAVSYQQSDREQGWARWEAQTGRIHPDRATQSGDVVDMVMGTVRITHGPSTQSH